MSIAIIANPEAGRGLGRRTAQEIEELFSAQGIEFQMLRTRAPREAIELSRRASRCHPVVVALGGDGTIGEVLEGMWDSDAVLGIIPAGTGNDYARSLRLPRNPLKAASVVLEGKTTTMDVGIERDKVFGVMASIGFPVSVIQRVNAREDKGFKGPATIVASIWKSLNTLKPFDVSITIDDHTYEERIVGLFVMNMSHGGGGLNIAPDAIYNDGQFTIVLMLELTGLQLLKALPKVYLGRHKNHPAVRFHTGTRFQIHQSGYQKMFDGDLHGTTPLCAHIIRGGARIRVPDRSE